MTEARQLQFPEGHPQEGLYYIGHPLLPKGVDSSALGKPSDVAAASGTHKTITSYATIGGKDYVSAAIPVGATVACNSPPGRPLR